MAPKKAETAAGSLFFVEGEVVEVLKDWGLAHVLGSDGLLYGLRPRTPGVQWDAVRKGQRVRCEVTGKFHRVLHADVLA